MGTLMGHVLPGAFFISFSIWWIIKGLWVYYTRPGHYVSSLTMGCCCRRRCCSNIPFDMWMLIALALTGGALEIITSYLHTNMFVMTNQQHLTMYTAFALAGVVSILVHHQVKFVPKGAEYMAFMMALVVELVLFAFHLHGRNVVDVHVHMLLVYTVAGGIIATAVEFRFPKSINAALARHFMTLAQGTWFVQVGFILYPPYKNTMDLDNKENIMLVTLMYAWHLIGCIIGIIFLASIVYYLTPKVDRGYLRDAEMRLLPGSGEAGTDHDKLHDANGSDEESDLFTNPKHLQGN